MKNTFKQFLEGSVRTLDTFVQHKAKNSEEEITDLLDKARKAVDDGNMDRSKALTAKAKTLHSDTKKYRERLKSINK